MSSSSTRCVSDRRRTADRCHRGDISTDSRRTRPSFTPVTIYVMLTLASCYVRQTFCIETPSGSALGAAASGSGTNSQAGSSPELPTTARSVVSDPSIDVINAVRCRVRCLSTLQNNMESSSSSSGMSAAMRESVTLLSCLQEPDCEARHDTECHQSCEFLRRVNSIRTGRCPPETQASGFAAICVTACQTDADCPTASHKCCSNSCGWTCQQSLHLYDGVPEIPERPTLRERPRGVELRWNSVAVNDSGPLLYIVDYRWNVGPHQNDAEMTPWQQISQTTSTSTVASDITPGHWYQFRVTAVNIYGSRGGSPPTKAFTLSKEPRKPGPPTNLTEGDTLIMGDKVAVTLHWFPPRKSDLPISRYKLFWSKKPRSSSQPTLRESQQTVPGDQLVFQIPDLEPDTTYFVQVQAICHYGDTRLKSDRANIYVTTYPLPHAPGSRHSSGESSRRMTPTNAARSMPTPSAPVDVVADTPIFHNGILKANVTWAFLQGQGRTSDIDRVFVFWSPEACIADSLPDDSLSKVFSGNTQDNSFVIYDLRFDCRYLVRVQSVSNQGVPGATSHITVSTPSCHDVTVVGKVRPDCPHNVPRIPNEPSDLQHSFLISSSNITARITWGVPGPLQSGEVPAVTGYRVVWGHTSSAHATIMDESIALTKVLTKDVRTLSIPNLLEGTNYVVRVRALSKSGSGRVASIHFTTPLLQLNPVDLPGDRHHQDGVHEDDDDDDDDYNSNYRESSDDGGGEAIAATVWGTRYWETVESHHQVVAPFVNSPAPAVINQSGLLPPLMALLLVVVSLRTRFQSYSLS